jgi:hypothetical protein
LRVHTYVVNPKMSLGRVRYDNFVMQRGWCLAHRLVASKFTPPTNSGASQNYHTARGVHVRRATDCHRCVWCYNLYQTVALYGPHAKSSGSRMLFSLPAHTTQHDDGRPWTGGLCSSDLEPPWLDLGPPLLIEGGVSGTSRGCRTCACRSSCCHTRTSNPRSSSSTPPNCTDVAGRSSCSRTPWGVFGDSDDMH